MIQFTRMAQKDWARFNGVVWTDYGFDPMTSDLVYFGRDVHGKEFMTDREHDWQPVPA